MRKRGHRPIHFALTCALGLLVLPLLAGLGASAGTPHFFPRQYYPGVSDSTDAQLLDLAPGEAASGLVLPMPEAGGILRGSVFGDNPPGEPVPLGGVLVEARIGRIVVGTRSDGDGNFELNAVPAGNVLVRFSTDVPLSDEPRFGALYYGGVERAGDAVRVPLSEGSSVDLERTTLHLGARLAGVVRTSDTAEPFDTARVVVTRLDAPGRWERTTNPDGQWSVDGLNPGAYRLFADVEGTAYLSEYFSDASDSTSAETVTLLPGETRAGLSLTPDRGGVIGGRITEESGRPIPNAAVEARRLETGRVRTVHCNGFGTYRFEGLPGGTYKVFVPLLNRYFPGTSSEDEARAITIVIHPVPTELSRVDVEGFPIEGCQVPDELQGVIQGELGMDFEEVDRAVIRAFTETDTVEIQPTRAGQYTIPCLPPGRYWVELVPEGPFRRQYHPKVNLFSQAVRVAIDADSMSRVDFVPERAVEISGRVLDDGLATPIEGAEVRVIETETGVAARAVTDETGSFWIRRQEDGTGLPAGLYRVVAESTLVPDPDLTPVFQPLLTAEPGAEGEILLEWRLTPGLWWRYLLTRHDAGDAEAQIEEGEYLPDAPEAGGTRIDRPEGDGPYRYRLRIWLLGGGAGETQEFTVWTDPVAPGTGPAPAAGLQVAPVPWDGRGGLQFRWGGEALPRDGLELRIYSVSGEELARLPWTAGASTTQWSGRVRGGRILSSGVYFAALRAPGWTGSARATIVVRR